MLGLFQTVSFFIVFCHVFLWFWPKLILVENFASFIGLALTYVCMSLGRSLVPVNHHSQKIFDLLSNPAEPWTAAERHCLGFFHCSKVFMRHAVISAAVDLLTSAITCLHAFVHCPLRNSSHISWRTLRRPSQHLYLWLLSVKYAYL